MKDQISLCSSNPYSQPKASGQPQQVELLNLQHTLYTSTNPTRRFLHETRRQWIVAAIHRQRREGGGRAVEIGPGSGVYLPVLSQAFEQVTAADIEPEFLAAARLLSESYPNITVVTDNIVASKLPDAAFDLVLCTEVIEHIPDSPSALTNMHRILRPGGVLILSTPQRYSTLELAGKVAFLPGVIELVRFIYREPIIETGHINLLTSREVRKQLKQAGFTVKESFLSGLYLPFIAEFLGNIGLDFEKCCERLLKRIGVTGLLWTQYYIAICNDERHCING